MGDGLGAGEIVLRLLGLEALEGRLLGGIGAESILVGVVGCDPESVTDGLRVVIGGCERCGAVAASAGGVVLVVADANGDTDDALVVGLLPHERAEVGQRLISGHVIEAILDEVWLEHPGQQQLACSRASSSCMAVSTGSEAESCWVAACAARGPETKARAIDPGTEARTRSLAREARTLSTAISLLCRNQAEAVEGWAGGRCPGAGAEFQSG